MLMTVNLIKVESFLQVRVPQADTFQSCITRTKILDLSRQTYSSATGILVITADCQQPTERLSAKTIHTKEQSSPKIWRYETTWHTRHEKEGKHLLTPLEILHF